MKNKNSFYSIAFIVLFSILLSSCGSSGGSSSPPPATWTQTVQSLTPDTTNPGQPATFTVTLMCNLSSCSSTTVVFYRSENNIISTNDTRLGSRTISRASRGQSRTTTLNYTEPSGLASRYFYGICIGNDCN